MTERPDVIPQIINVLTIHPEGLNIIEIAEKTGMNRMSAAKYLDVLMAQELVRAETYGRAKVYYFAGQQVPAAAFRASIPVHYAITDCNLVILQLNDFVPRTIGKIGARLPDLVQQQVSNFEECMAAFESALAGRESTVVARFLPGQGPAFCEARCVPLQFPDGSAGMMVLLVEIPRVVVEGFAARDEAGTMREIVEGLANPVFRIGPDGLVTYQNSRAAEWGLLPESLLGRPFADLAVPEDRESVLTGLESVQRSQQGTVRFRALAYGGRVLRIEADCRVSPDASGACTGVICLLRDVSEGNRQ